MGFGQFLRILRARLGLIATILFATVALGVAVTLLLPKRYDASASVIVEIKLADMVSGSNYSQSTGERVDNVISTNQDIIGSPNVALKVVEALRLESNPRAKELLSGGGPLSAVREWIAGVQEWISNLLPGAETERPAMSLKDWMADRLLRNLKLNANRDSRLIKVTYSSPDAEFSAATANAFVRAYRATLLQMQVAPAKQNTQWFDEQVKEFRRNLEQAEAKLAKFQQEKGIVATDERMDIESARMADISTQLAAAQSMAYESQARQQQLRNFLARGDGATEAPPEVSTSPAVQQLRQSVASAEAKLNEMSGRIGKNHPQYQAAAADVQRLQGQLREEMRASAQSFVTSGGVPQQREGALRGALEQQRAKVLRLKADRNELAALMRDADNAQKAYNTAVQRFTQTKMESQVDQTSGAIVDSAPVPTKPASPNVALNLAIALVAGLIFGVGAALFGETLNRYVRSEEDILEIVGIPVLAVLTPKLGRANVRQLRGPSMYSLPRM
jgi:succinoglycan biosynthesis transport protein ExoP